MAAPETQQPTFEDLELLVEVSKLLTVRDLSTVMEQVIDLMASSIDATKSSLFLVDGLDVDWEHIFTARSLGKADMIRVVSEVLDQGLAGWVVRNKTGAIIYDTYEDERWHVFPDDTTTVRSVVCVPFTSNNQVTAVLTLTHTEPNHFTNYQLRLMTIISNQASVAIRNAQLFKRLDEKQRQLEIVLQSVPDVLLVTDQNKEIILLNDGALQFLGMQSYAEATGISLNAFQGGDELMQQLVFEITSDIADDQQVSFEARSNHHQADYAVTISTWEKVNGKRGGYVIVMHDVTTLRDLYRFKDEMLRIASHDLRSPLSIISGYADMIEYDAEEGSPLHEYTEAIHRSIERMDNLLEDLLQVRQIDEKGLNVEPGTVMIDLARPVYQGAVLLGRQKNQIIVEDFHIDDSVIGAVDPMRLRQAMDNFATNAIKYTQEGGQIILRAYVRDGRFFFEVEDNGIGIPKDSIPHLFESFYRVNANLNVSITGAGLGLSLVKSIVERHQGEVWVESEEGVGSLFGLWVPI